MALLGTRASLWMEHSGHKLVGVGWGIITQQSNKHIEHV